MSPTRREFITRVGISIASLMTARCACTQFIPGGRITGTSPRERLRNCWFSFDWLEKEASDWSDYEKGEKALEQLSDDHRAALDDLVADGELEAVVADEVHVAFEAAAWHIWRANCGMTCYEPMPGPEYTPMASSQLVSQSELLEDLADDSSVDQDIVAKAQVAIERDITFLNFSGKEEKELYDALIAAGGESYNYPHFDDVELEISPEAAEAAKFLVALLLEE